jgi:UDP-N-acetylmuramoyl-L-alanyl-D-glutamate--2,6-diaminopimelate ligase
VTGKTIGDLISVLGNAATVRGDPTAEIRGLAYDSRRVEAGDLFVALTGFHSDGHRFIGQATERGAMAVLHQTELSSYQDRVIYVKVPDSRQAMSALAAALYDHPSRQLSVIGVTGTDGKSTTVWLIQQLLEVLGKPCGFISTVQVKTRSEVITNPHRQSTPEAPDIQRLLRQMVEAGKRYSVIEATSHGLSAKTARLSAVDFAAAVCTNISHEHLEFHGSFEQYRSDKANLFRGLPADGFGVVNLDDANHQYLIDQSAAPVLGYGIENTGGDLYAAEIRSDLSGSSFTLRRGTEAKPARFNLLGAYNLANLLAAALTVLRLVPVPLENLVQPFPDLQGVPGRMETITAGQPFQVIVDYAHTPQSFTELFPLIRSHTEGRLIAVFGSAGERDVKKRPLQGELAARFCDIVVLTDEDPRDEDPVAILEEIASGCRKEDPGRREGENLFLIPDRRQAIARAFTLAGAGDTVLLLGKGHEESIIYANGPVPWQEAQSARQILGEMGWKP